MPGALSLPPFLPQLCVCVPVRARTVSGQEEQIREQPLCKGGGGVPGHRVITGTACGGQADRESHCPRHVVLSLLLTSSPLTPHFFFFSTLPCPTSFHSYFCLLLGISVCLTMVLQVLFPIEQPHSFSGKLLSKTQNDDFSHTTNVSKYITSILFFPSLHCV